MEIKTYAKVNLSLDVVGRRADGYHLVEMVMHKVPLCDTLFLGWEEAETGDLRIEISCDAAGVPLDSANLAWKAAELLHAEHCPKLSGTLRIGIEKKVPVAGGLGGGSGNAAGVLRGACELWDLGLAESELMRLAAEVGADVPFCLSPYTCALATGVGTDLAPLPPLPQSVSIRLYPQDLEVSTKDVYAAYDTLTEEEIGRRPNTAALIEGLREGNLKKVEANMANVLEKAACKLYPCIMYSKNKIKGTAHMSGSGPTLFTLEEKL